MKTNLFLCRTEYHILMSIFLCRGLFYSIEYKNKVYVSIGLRLKDKTDFNFGEIHNIEFIPIDYTETEDKRLLNRAINECNNEFITFNLTSIIESHIAYVSSKQNIGFRSSICQEGLAMYNSEKYIGGWSQIKYAIKALLNCKRKHLLGCGFLRYWMLRNPRNIARPIYDIQYAIKQGVFKNVYASFPEVLNINHQSIMKIPEINDDIISTSKYFFNVENENLSIEKGDILFIDQPLSDYTALDFLKEIEREYPEKNIYVKMHPKSSIMMKDRYGILKRVRFVESQKIYPVELLLMEQKEINIVSAFSTALLINNPKCKFFYIYPILKEKGVLNNINFPHLTNHITLIHNIEEFRQNII